MGASLRNRTIDLLLTMHAGCVCSRGTRSCYQRSDGYQYLGDVALRLPMPEGVVTWLVTRLLLCWPARCPRRLGWPARCRRCLGWPARCPRRLGWPARCRRRLGWPARCRRCLGWPARRRRRLGWPARCRRCLGWPARCRRRPGWPARCRRCLGCPPGARAASVVILVRLRSRRADISTAKKKE